MYTDKQIFKVSYPIILSLLAQNIINITDTAFLGHVGEIELGGSALGGLWYLAIFMAGFGFSIGAQILMGRRNGEKRYSDIAPIFIQGTLFLLFLAVLIVMFTEYNSAWLLKSMIKSDNVYNATIEFLDWRILGLFFSFPNAMFRAFYVGVTNTRALTIGAIIMAVVNVFLDYAMIFGKFGFQEAGLVGAAQASVIAEIAAIIYFIIYSFKKIDLKKYGFLQKGIYNMRKLPHILSVSLWTMIQSFLALSTWFFFFLATEHLGERSLAVSNIVRSVSAVLFMPVSAYGTTANTLVSNLIGENRLSEVAPTITKIIKQCIYFVLPIMVIILLIPELIVRVYTNDFELINATLPSLMVLVFSYICATPGMIFHQSVSGTGNTRWGLIIEVITLVFYVSFVVVTAFILKTSVDICWFSEFVYWGLLFIISYLYMKKANWQSKRI